MTQMIEQLSPGLHIEVPFADYLRWPLMSQSILKEGREEDGSMRKLKNALDGQRNVVVTDDMALGSALHVCFLEPEEMPNRVAVYESVRRGATWEEFRTEHAGKVILTEKGHAKLKGMVRSLRSTPEVRDWQAKIAHVELSAVGEIDGVKFKARCDALTDDPIWDLKKVRGINGRTIDQTIWEFGYHIQGYIYTQLFDRTRFCLGLVEDSEPFEPRIIELSERWLKIGKFETQNVLRQYKACCEKKPPSWPFRYSGIDVVEPPAWVEEKFGSRHKITIGGETV